MKDRRLGNYRFDDLRLKLRSKLDIDINIKIHDKFSILNKTCNEIWETVYFDINDKKEFKYYDLY